MKGYKILVADDSITVHKLMETVLRPTDYQLVATAKNGQEAIHLYKEHQPDLVLLDITMPILDGIGALKGIKGTNPKAKVIMLSAMADKEIVNEALHLGASTFLQKPFKREELVGTIQKVLEE